MNSTHMMPMIGAVPHVDDGADTLNEVVLPVLSANIRGFESTANLAMGEPLIDQSFSTPDESRVVNLELARRAKGSWRGESESAVAVVRRLRTAWEEHSL